MEKRERHTLIKSKFERINPRTLTNPQTKPFCLTGLHHTRSGWRQHHIGYLSKYNLWRRQDIYRYKKINIYKKAIYCVLHKKWSGCLYWPVSKEYCRAWLRCHYPYLSVSFTCLVVNSVAVKRQFFSMSRICNEKCSKPKIFLAFLSKLLCFSFIL